jgi:hypothetical protein
LLGELEAYLQRVSNEVNQTYAQAKAYVAPYGQKGKHEDKVKELKKLSEKSAQDVEDFGAQKRRATAIFSKPIKIRIYYRIAEEQIELATWDGQPTVVRSAE